MITKLITGFLALTFSATVAFSDDSPDTETKLFWGDTHLHTKLSGDAFGFGVILGPADAYRLAKGEKITASSNQPVKLARPLDFLVVADHAEGYGLMGLIKRGDKMIMINDTLIRWNKLLNGDEADRVKAVIEMIDAQASGKLATRNIMGDILRAGVWYDSLQIADQYNDPGKFTALLGFEWTSMVSGKNLHRVVVFRDDADKAGQTYPLDSNISGMNPAGLWSWMQDYETKTGGKILAIPHNSNLSNGMMFSMQDFDGSELTREYAERRMRWEPLVEASQIKGDSETHPTLSPNDEFADYETWDKGNLTLSELKTPEMLPGDYVRSGLKRGLMLDEKLGANPYKFGLIGATDSHTAISSSEENNFWGKHSGTEPQPGRINKPFRSTPQVRLEGWQMVTSGIAAVWATENTRAGLFDAMQRKEVYATTGPRMAVRLFGGWDFEAGDAKSRDIAATGYAGGVPMGGDLTAAPDGKAPSFLVSAQMDPLSGTLDRVQMVKGWVDADGKAQEQVYDIAWSGERTIGEDGKLPPVGNTVNVKAATWTNTIGAAELVTVWQDPDFKLDQRAFYYVRVLEIPTPRWTAFDAKRFNVEMGPEVPMTTQERAYTSPIWYTP